MYQTDAILTQVVSLLAKLHRVTLRNWHETLAVIGNFAYTQDTAIDDLIEKGKKKFNYQKCIV